MIIGAGEIRTGDAFTVVTMYMIERTLPPVACHVRELMKLIPIRTRSVPIPNVILKGTPVAEASVPSAKAC